jgi:hypothetical protein
MRICSLFVGRSKNSSKNLLDIGQAHSPASTGAVCY